MRVSMHSSQHMPTDFRGSRSGATLTEVLISLLAMGIGVVAVATMFPISVLKSVRATQLTRAAILSMNANSQIHADQRFLNDPDFYRDSLSGAPYDSESKGPFEHFSEDINGNGRLDQGEDFDGNGVLEPWALHGRSPRLGVQQQFEQLDHRDLRQQWPIGGNWIPSVSRHVHAGTN